MELEGNGYWQICLDCGYRWDYFDICPQCASHNTDEGHMTTCECSECKGHEEKEMTNKDEIIVQEIKKELTSKLQAIFGYCGVMEGNDHIMLNSGKGNIVINIQWEKEEAK